MFSKLLLVLGIAVGYGTNLTLKTSQKVYNQAYSYDSTNNENFYYYNLLFTDWSVSWLDNNSKMKIVATVQTSHFVEMPDKVFDYFYFGDFGFEYDFYNIVVYYPGNSLLIESPLNNSFPFVKSSSGVLYDKSLFPDYSFNYSITVNFGYSIDDASARVYAEFCFIYVAFTNEIGIANYYADLQNVAYNDGYNDGYYDGYNDGDYDGYNDGYDDGYYDGYRDGDYWGYQDGYFDGKDDGYDIGFADAEAIADGTWLGNLVFGTIGGIVGFLFALSDFEVLGVSIMSIITLFVAIGIVRLLFKVLK